MKVIIDYEIHRTITVNMEEANYNPDLLNRHGKEYFAETVFEDTNRDGNQPGIKIKDKFYIEGVSVTN